MMLENVKIHDYPVTCRQFGSVDPLVLFLSGAGGPEMCVPFARALGEWATVLLPEHPGFGDADKPDWLRGIPDLAQFYALLLRDHIGRPVHLVGHSLGGWIAAEMAVRCTRLIASLTLISAGGVKVKGVPIADNFLWPRERLAERMCFDPANFPASSAPPTPEQLRTMLRRQAVVAELVWKPRWHDPQLQRWLPAIDCPTQILWGREDALFPIENAQLYADLIAGSELTVIPECGHLPFIEQPGVVRDAIAAAFSRN